MWIEKLAVTAQEAFKSAMDIASKHEAATTEPLSSARCHPFCG